MAALLTCSWVLWHATFKITDMKWSYSVSEAYDSKLECEQHGQRSMAIAASSGQFKQQGNALWNEKRNELFSFKCLPDTVKP
jgi:hypothetical protein